MSHENDLLPFFRRPFFYFSVFLASNTLLSYASLPAAAWLGTLLAGIVLPLVLVLLSGRKAGGRPFPVPFEQELVFPPGWIGGLIALIACFVRFYHLAHWDPWPTKDEGNYFFAAMEMNRRESIPFFYSTGEIPPGFRWLQALWLRAVEPSLDSFWFFPALISLLTVPLGYGAARTRFSKTFSLVLGLLLAGSFWPVWLGHFCVLWVLLFFWECWVLGLLGFCLSSGSPRGRAAWSIGLGICAGSTAYISGVLSPFLLLAAALVLLGAAVRKPSIGWKPFFLFLLSAGAALLPFYWEVLTQNFGSHIHELWPGGMAFSLFSQARLGWNYLAGLFWGVDSPDYDYGPVMGGFLNPLLGAFFFSAVAWFLEKRAFLFLGSLGGIFLVFLTPGFLTHDLEMQRVLLTLPLLLGMTAAGAVILASQLSRRWITLFLALALSFSAGLDFYRLRAPLVKALNQPWETSPSLKSEESFRAYQALNQKAEKDGPGWLLLDYVSVPLDQTLGLGTYPFNAVDNPKLRSAHPTWMAFLTNVNYRPFLERRFPEASWILVGSKLMPWDGELLLGILPVTEQNRATLDFWMRAQPVFHAMTLGLVRQSEGKSRQLNLEDFCKGYPLVQGDPFLVSVFGEIAYFNHSADKNFLASLSDLGMVLREGYPAAHIFNELGGLLWFRKDKVNARLAFSKAVQLGGAHTPAMENLRSMEAEPK